MTAAKNPLGLRAAIAPLLLPLFTLGFLAMTQDGPQLWAETNFRALYRGAVCDGSSYGHLLFAVGLGMALLGAALGFARARRLRPRVLGLVVMVVPVVFVGAWALLWWAGTTGRCIP